MRETGAGLPLRGAGRLSLRQCGPQVAVPCRPTLLQRSAVLGFLQRYFCDDPVREFVGVACAVERARAYRVHACCGRGHPIFFFTCSFCLRPPYGSVEGLVSFAVAATVFL